MRFDLARHRARAELLDGGDRLLDFGAPGGASVTLGGWRTRTGDTHRFGEMTTLLVEGVTGEIVLPVTEGSERVALRARAFGDGRPAPLAYISPYVDFA